MTATQALLRLRQRYDGPATAPTQEHLQYNAHLAHASAVRAAAVAPHRPPAACAAAELLLPGWSASPQQQQDAAGRGARCAVCGSTQDSKGGSSSCSSLAADQQQLQPTHQQSCRVCGRLLSQGKAAQHASSSGSSGSSQLLPGLTEISPDDSQPVGTRGAPTAGSSSSSHNRLRGGWWQRITSAVGMDRSLASQQAEQQQQPQGAGSSVPAGLAGALPGSWGPSLRPYPVLTPTHSNAEQLWQQQHQPPPWSLSPRDASIGRSVMWVGEFVHVVRPLVYVCMLKKYGLSSWKPWLTMLALDAASGVWFWCVVLCGGSRSTATETCVAQQMQQLCCSWGGWWAAPCILQVTYSGGRSPECAAGLAAAVGYGLTRRRAAADCLCMPPPLTVPSFGSSTQ